MRIPTINLRVDAITDASSPAALHYMLGRKYATTDQLEQSLQAFTMALSLDEELPGIAQAISATLDPKRNPNRDKSVLEALANFYAGCTPLESSTSEPQQSFSFMTYWKDAEPFAPNTIDAHRDIIRERGYAYWGVIHLGRVQPLWRGLVRAFNQLEHKFLFIFGPNTYYRPTQHSLRRKPFKSFHVAKVHSLIQATDPRPPGGLEAAHVPDYYWKVCDDPDLHATVPYWFRIEDLAELTLFNLEESDYPHASLVNGFNGRRIDLNNLGVIPFPAVATLRPIHQIVKAHRVFPDPPDRAATTLRSEATLYDVIATAYVDDTPVAGERLARKIVEEVEGRQSVSDMAPSNPETAAQTSDLLDAAEHLFRLLETGGTSNQVRMAIRHLAVMIFNSRRFIASLPVAYVERALSLGMKLKKQGGFNEVTWPDDDLIRALWSSAARDFDTVLGVDQSISKRVGKLLDLCLVVEPHAVDSRGELLGMKILCATKVAGISSQKKQQKMRATADEAVAEIENRGLLSASDRKLLQDRVSLVWKPDSPEEGEELRESGCCWVALPESEARGGRMCVLREPGKGVVVIHEVALEFARAYPEELQFLCSRFLEPRLSEGVDAMRWRGTKNGLWRWRRHSGAGLRLYGWREGGVTEIAHAADAGTKEDDDTVISTLAKRQRKFERLK